MLRKNCFFLVLLFGMFFIGCNDKDPDEDNNSSSNTTKVYLTGTYGRYMVSSGTVNDRLIFTKTDVTFNKSSGTIFKGTYKYDGATLTLTIGGVDHVKYATFDGSTIIITGDGAYSEYVKDKWVIKNF